MCTWEFCVAQALQTHAEIHLDNNYYVHVNANVFHEIPNELSMQFIAGEYSPQVISTPMPIATPYLLAYMCHCLKCVRLTVVLKVRHCLN